MSYDIYLYEKAFLKRALEQNLDDWTNADLISEEKKGRIRQSLKAKGYRIVGEKPTSQEYRHPNKNWAITVSIYTGEIAITIPYWKDAENAVHVALVDAKEFADVAQLALYDPQADDKPDDASDYPEDEEEI